MSDHSEWREAILQLQAIESKVDNDGDPAWPTSCRRVRPTILCSVEVHGQAMSLFFCIKSYPSDLFIPRTNIFEHTLWYVKPPRVGLAYLPMALGLLCVVDPPCPTPKVAAPLISSLAQLCGSWWHWWWRLDSHLTLVSHKGWLNSMLWCHAHHLHRCCLWTVSLLIVVTCLLDLHSKWGLLPSYPDQYWYGCFYTLYYCSALYYCILTQSSAGHFSKLCIILGKRAEMRRQEGAAYLVFLL